MRTPTFSKEQQLIIDAANAAVQEHGADLKKFYVVYDEGNALWRSSVGNIHVPELDGHDYQLVIYAHRDKLQIGGDLWVLVDKNTREVLIVIPRG